MIGKTKNTIIRFMGDKVLSIDKKDIEQYLSEMKDAVRKNRYRLDRNARRQDNIALFLDYVIDEAKAKEIILSLTAMDFSDILQNEHKGYEHERLYVFGKDVILLERNGTEEKTSFPVYQIQQVGKLLCNRDFIPRAEISAYILFQIIRRQIGGDHDDREWKTGILYRVQNGNRVSFAEKGNCKNHKR